MATAAAHALLLGQKLSTGFGRRCTTPLRNRSNYTLSFSLCVCQASGPGQLLLPSPASQLLLATPAGAASLFGSSLAVLPATITSAKHMQVAVMVPPPSPPPSIPPPPTPIPPHRDFFAVDVAARVQLPSSINIADVCSMLLPASNLTAMRAYAADFARRYVSGLRLPAASGSTIVRVGRLAAHAWHCVHVQALQWAGA